MTNPVTGRDSVLNDAGRPSLYGTASTDTTAEIFSILDALEPPQRKSTWLRRLTSGLLLVAVVAAIAATASSRYGHVFPVKGWLEAAFKRGTAVVPPSDASWQQQQASPSVPEIQAPLVATIVDDVAVAEEKDRQTAADAIEQRALPAEAAQEAVPGGQTFVADSGEKRPTQAKATAKSAAREKADTKYSQRGVGRAAQASTSASVGQKGKDKDVDLIAALLSHVSRSAGGEREPAKARNSSSGASAAPPAFKRERLSDSNREVVLRSSGESTDSLVMRCQSLGFFEGQLCRMRICSDLWGKDPACPLPTVNSSN